MDDQRTILLSIIIPVYNEAENIRLLADEILTTLSKETIPFEILFINEGSTDNTLIEVMNLSTSHSIIRFISHRKNHGQSIVVITGVKHARGKWIATLDGDGQNDPKDILKLFTIAIASPDEKNLLIAGHRVTRKDNWSKKISTKVANHVRSRLLKDNCPDTGCGLKVFQRDFFMILPNFNHMHRFLPALTRRENGQVINIPVNHRPRLRGKSKYGIWNRLWIGISDLIGVAWLIRRNAHAEINHELIHQPIAKEMKSV